MVQFEISKRDLEEFNKQIKDISKKFDDKTLRKIFRKGSKPYITAVRSSAPKATKTVKRYNTAKVLKGARAPKGSGNVIAEYTPGNLGRSMKVLPLRRAKRAVIVGPKKVRNSRGIFSGRRADGYYAHMVEFGTTHSASHPFVEPAWQASKGAVLSNIIGELRKEIDSAV